MDMILKTTNLCKNFKGQTAVNNVSLNIQRNSVYGLLGPNGEANLPFLKCSLAFCVLHREKLSLTVTHGTAAICNLLAH